MTSSPLISPRLWESRLTLLKVWRPPRPSGRYTCAGHLWRWWVVYAPNFPGSTTWLCDLARDDAGLRTVVSNRRLLRQSWCYIPGLMRAGPSGEERFTPHYTVPVSPQCPQEISLLTLPVFQGAAVSSERFSQSLPPRNVAELGGSPPLRGSLEQLDRPSPAGPPLQGTELAALSTPETSLERLVPLVDYSAAWNCCQMCLDGSRTL